MRFFTKPALKELMRSFDRLRMTSEGLGMTGKGIRIKFLFLLSKHAIET
jgi:hypothetical protein